MAVVVFGPQSSALRCGLLHGHGGRAATGNAPRTKVSPFRSHVLSKENVPTGDVLRDAFSHVVYANSRGEVGRSFARSSFISKELHKCCGELQDVTISIDATHPLATSSGAAAWAPQIDVPPLIGEYDVDIAQRRGGDPSLVRWVHPFQPANQIPLKHGQRFSHSTPNISHIQSLTHQHFRTISGAKISSFLKVYQFVGSAKKPRFTLAAISPHLPHMLCTTAGGSVGRRMET